MPTRSDWSLHALKNGTRAAAYTGYPQPIEARRCTVQLASGRLYLDVVASRATALLGHDLPPLQAVNLSAVQQMLSSLEPGYVCITMTDGFESAAELAMRIGHSAAAAERRIVEVSALEGEPGSGTDFLVVHEDETLGRTGRWLASAAWQRPPDLVVISEALALGSPFGAVLASADREWEFMTVVEESSRAIESATLARVASAIRTLESEELLAHGGELADYLKERLMAMRESCPQIVRIERAGLSIRLSFAPPISAHEIRRRMCGRGVLVGVDDSGRLAIDPPLPLRVAEADVVLGVLRGAVLNLPMVSAPACCAACEGEV